MCSEKIEAACYKTLVQLRRELRAEWMNFLLRRTSAQQTADLLTGQITDLFQLAVRIQCKGLICFNEG